MSALPKPQTVDEAGIAEICQLLQRAIEIADEIGVPALRHFLAMAALEAVNQRPSAAPDLVRLLYREG